MEAAKDPNSCNAGKKGPTPAGDIISLTSWQNGDGVKTILDCH
jgi:hypothetical protein